MSKAEFANNKDWPAPGVYVGISDEIYHSTGGMASQTLLKEVAKAPAFCKHAMESPRKPSRAMVISSAAHSWTLESDTFWDHYFRKPSGDGRKAAVKKMIAEAEASNPGKEGLSDSEMEVLEGCGDALRNHSRASKLLAHCNLREVAMVWQDERTGQLCKGKVDAYSMEMGLLMDLKFLADVKPHSLPGIIASDRYYAQGPFYIEGLRAHGFPANRFVIVAIQKAPPFPVLVREIEGWHMEAAAVENKNLLTEFAYCSDTDEWPGYPEEIEVVEMPIWKERQLERLLGR